MRRALRVEATSSGGCQGDIGVCGGGKLALFDHADLVFGALDILFLLFLGLPW